MSVSGCRMDKGRIPCRKRVENSRSRTQDLNIGFLNGVSEVDEFIRLLPNESGKHGVAMYSYNPLKIVTACGKLLSDLFDSLKSEHAVLCSIFLIVLFAEICKVMFKDFMQLVSAAGYIIILSKVKSCVPE